MKRSKVIAALFFAVGCAGAVTYGIGKRRSERRKSRRREFRANALITNDDDAFSGEIRNISNMGAYLATKSSHAVNDPLELTIYFEHDANNLKVTVPCKVARIDEQGIGLVSSHIDPNTLLHLKLLFSLNKRDPKQLIEAFCKAL